MKKALFEESAVRREFFDDGVFWALFERALCGLRCESKNNVSGKGNLLVATTVPPGPSNKGCSIYGVTK